MNWEVRTMGSATSFFNSTLYRKTMARFWPLWALYGVVWLFAVPLNLMNGYFQSIRWGWTVSEAQEQLLDQALDGESAMFMSASVCYFIANEGISILENLTLLGVKIPEALRAALELMNRKSQGTSQDK